MWAMSAPISCWNCLTETFTPLKGSPERRQIFAIPSGRQADTISPVSAAEMHPKVPGCGWCSSAPTPHPQHLLLLFLVSLWVGKTVSVTFESAAACFQQEVFSA